jgi:hypothetical protein
MAHEGTQQAFHFASSNEFRETSLLLLEVA